MTNAGVESAPGTVAEPESTENEGDIKVYRMRWVVLAAFCFLSLLNGFQWVQYAVVSDLVASYYKVTDQAVDWASMLYMIMYLPFVGPASWMLDTMGPRRTVVLAGVLNCLGAWIKVASASPSLFWVTMLGQTVAAVTQAFVLAVPARLAAVWFGAGEVSTACGIGVFGNQMGNALGFAVPPLLTKSGATSEEIGVQFSILYYGLAAACTLSLIIVLLVFQDAPPSPPSVAQAEVIAQASSHEASKSSFSELLGSMVRMARTPGFVLLFVSYGTSVGVYYAIGTILNRLLQSVFRDSQDAGNIGLLLVVAGLAGSVVCGVLLDKTRKYKEVTLGVYFLSFVGMVAFGASFFSSSIWPVYVTAGLLGFFLAGYLPLGFELAVELTYPEPEGTSAGLLNVSAQIFGMLFTELCDLPLEHANDGLPNAHVWVNATLSAILVLGTILTALIPNTLRRQAVQAEKGGELRDAPT